MLGTKMNTSGCGERRMEGVCMKKNFLSIAMAAVMSASLMPTVVYADGENEISVDMETAMETVAAENFPDADELFAGYVDQVFYGKKEVSLMGEDAGNQLTGFSKEMYTFLKEEIAKVAAGSLVSTEFRPTFTWTAQDLGVEKITNENVNALLDTKWEELNMQAVVWALLHDCPYELYWYDKTTGTNTSLVDASANSAWMSMELSIAMYVAKNYMGADNLTTNAVLTSATTAAKAKADEIVTANAENSDYEKLVAYKEAICNLVDYDFEAIKDTYTDGYGDPWQMIHVFDGNADTNVVCEGYSKAFQYLCDESEFNNTKCYTVSGYTSGGHMWNIVTMNDGRNYMVDITNSDNGSAGQDGELFLKGYTSKTTTSGGGDAYTYSVNNNLQTITYSYKPETIQRWDSSILKLTGKAAYDDTAAITERTVAMDTEDGEKVLLLQLPEAEETEMTVVVAEYDANGKYLGCTFRKMKNSGTLLKPGEADAAKANVLMLENNHNPRHKNIENGL